MKGPTKEEMICCMFEAARGWPLEERDSKKALRDLEGVNDFRVEVWGKIHDAFAAYMFELFNEDTRRFGDREVSEIYIDYLELACRMVEAIGIGPRPHADPKKSLALLSPRFRNAMLRAAEAAAALLDERIGIPHPDVLH